MHNQSINLTEKSALLKGIAYRPAGYFTVRLRGEEMTKLIVCILILATLCGCATYQEFYGRRFSGVIGCPPEEVVIVSEEKTFVNKSMVVECRGRRFHCSESLIYGDNNPPVCKEELK
jgi:hypothetical protein